jgi:hypothetical protein
MKSLLFTFFFVAILAISPCYSQDLIYLKNDTIRAKILEIGIKHIKFQEIDFPVKEIRKRDVLRLEYANGAIDDFGSMNPRKIRPLSMGLVISDFLPEDMYLAQFELNYFLEPYLTLSFNAGIDTKGNNFLTGGTRYYFNKTHSKHKLVPFIGCQVGFGYVQEDNSTGFLLEFPFGIDYITKAGYNFSIEYCAGSLSNYEALPDRLGFKIGKNF